MVNYGNSFLYNLNQTKCNSFLQNQNQTKCNSFQRETKREIIFCFMTQKNDSIIYNCVYSGNSTIRDRKRDKAKVSFALTGRNPLRIFLIISGSMSQKYFWADRLQRLSWWFSMIYAPKEYNKKHKSQSHLQTVRLAFFFCKYYFLCYCV